MDINNTPFYTILKSQIDHKNDLIKKESPPENGFTISILNNKIYHTKCNGTNYQKRKKQTLELFRAVLKKYKLKNCHININCDKIPKDFYFFNVMIQKQKEVGD